MVNISSSPSRTLADAEGYSFSSQSIRGGTAKVVSYERDQLGQMTQLTIPTTVPVGGVVLDYTYTSLGQVDTIGRAGTQLVNYSYMGTFVTGRSYLQAGINLTNVHDNFGRLTESKTLNGSGQGVEFGYTYGYIDDNNTYHNGDNILSQTYNHRDNDPANGFGYDDLNRLTKASYRIFSGDEDNNFEQFNYDLLGNRIPQTGSLFGYKDARPNPDVTCAYTHDLANEYQTIGGVTVLHDDAGNLKQDKNGYTYHYDYENRLVEIRKTNDTIVIATFEYDALGRRIEKVDAIAGTVKRYYYDDQRIVLQTTTPSGGSETDYRYFAYGNYIDEVLVMGSKLGSLWLSLYYGHDHLYSPAVLFTSVGAVTERYEYDAYGKATIWDPGFTTIRSVPSTICVSPFSFTGRELDYFDNNTLKLMYYRARSYDPQTGRFLQRDPLGVNPAGGKQNLFDISEQYNGGLNIYEYVHSNPANNYDYSELNKGSRSRFRPCQTHPPNGQPFWFFYITSFISIC